MDLPEGTRTLEIYSLLCIRITQMMAYHGMGWSRVGRKDLENHLITVAVTSRLAALKTMSLVGVLNFQLKACVKIRKHLWWLPRNSLSLCCQDLMAEDGVPILQDSPYYPSLSPGIQIELHFRMAEYFHGLSLPTVLLLQGGKWLQ